MIDNFLYLGEQQGEKRLDAAGEKRGQRSVRGDADARRAPAALRRQGEGRLRRPAGVRPLRRIQHRLPQEH